MSNIRILLCEDQTLVRHGLRTILELEPGMAVAGEAADGEAAAQRALELKPDIVLMDIQMPRRRGSGGHRADHGRVPRHARDRADDVRLRGVRL